MTIDELRDYCNREFSSINSVTDEIFTVYGSDKQEYSIAEQAALGAFIMNIYSGMENILKQMLLFDQLNLSDSPDWHNKVLQKSAELGILPPDLFQILSKYLSFRNYFIYSYVFNINWDDMRDLVDAIRDVTARVRTEVDEYLQTI